MAHIISTSMHSAFLAASVKRGTGAGIINRLARCFNNPRAGTISLGKGWNAHLSFKTAKLIDMPECSNPQALEFVKGHGRVPNMPYDAMVRDA